MDHVVIPLDRDHVGSLALVAEGLAAGIGLSAAAATAWPHITLAAHYGLAEDELGSVEQLAAATTPFTVHAHGFGFFTGDRPTSLSLHVPVVRSPELDALHRRICDALHQCGVVIATWSQP